MWPTGAIFNVPIARFVKVYQMVQLQMGTTASSDFHSCGLAPSPAVSSPREALVLIQ